MKQKFLNAVLLIIACTFQYMPILAEAVPGEGIVFDPISGNYKITYWEEVSDDAGNDLSGLSVATFEPATKIDPVVTSLIRLNQNGQINYRYKIKNGAKSKQPLLKFWFDLTGNISASRPLLKPQPGSLPDKQSILADLIAGENALTTPSGWSGGGD